MSEPTVGRIVGLMALFVLLGVPMVAFLWETLHQLLTMRLDPMRLLVAVPVLALFAGLLYFAARRFARETETPQGPSEKG